MQDPGCKLYSFFFFSFFLFFFFFFHVMHQRVGLQLFYRDTRVDLLTPYREHKRKREKKGNEIRLLPVSVLKLKSNDTEYGC